MKFSQFYRSYQSHSAWTRLWARSVGVIAGLVALARLLQARNVSIQGANKGDKIMVNDCFFAGFPQINLMRELDFLIQN